MRSLAPEEAIDVFCLVMTAERKRVVLGRGAEVMSEGSILVAECARVDEDRAAPKMQQQTQGIGMAVGCGGRPSERPGVEDDQNLLIVRSVPQDVIAALGKGTAATVSS